MHTLFPSIIHKGTFSYLTTNNHLHINIKPNDLASILGHMFKGCVERVETWHWRSSAAFYENDVNVLAATISPNKKTI